MSRAVEVMVQHVENLKRHHMREHAELEEMKRLIQQNSRNRQLAETQGEVGSAAGVGSACGDPAGFGPKPLWGGQHDPELQSQRVVRAGDRGAGDSWDPMTNARGRRDGRRSVGAGAGGRRAIVPRGIRHRGGTQRTLCPWTPKPTHAIATRASKVPPAAAPLGQLSMGGSFATVCASASS